MTPPIDTGPDHHARSDPAASSSATADAPGDAGTVDAAGPGTAAPRKRRRRGRTIALLVGAPILAALLAYGAFQVFRPHIYSGTVMQAPTAAPPMDDLMWTDGTPVDLTAFEGDIVVLYFGYTYCPDVCPTTLAQVATARAELGDKAERVHVMMVSVDPERDDLESLGEYVRSFDPDFLGASGELAAVERVAATYGVFFARGEEYADGGYAVDHTASLMGIDKNGHLRIVWAPAAIDTDALAADFDALL